MEKSAVGVHETSLFQELMVTSSNICALAIWRIFWMCMHTLIITQWWMKAKHESTSYKLYLIQNFSWISSEELAIMKRQHYYCIMCFHSYWLVTKSNIALNPCCPVWGILNETQTFKEPLGDHVVILYVSVHWVALSIESLGHGTDNCFGIAFPPVLWQSVQHPYGTVIIHQNPGHWLTLVVSDTTWWEVADEVFNSVVAFLVSSKFPSSIHQVNMGKVKRWDLWVKLTVEKK